MMEETLLFTIFTYYPIVHVSCHHIFTYLYVIAYNEELDIKILKMDFLMKMGT